MVGHLGELMEPGGGWELRSASIGEGPEPLRRGTSAQGLRPLSLRDAVGLTCWHLLGPANTAAQARARTGLIF